MKTYHPRGIVLLVSSVDKYFQNHVRFNTGNGGDKKKVEVCNKNAAEVCTLTKKCITREIIAEILVNHKPCLFTWKCMAHVLPYLFLNVAS